MKSLKWDRVNAWRLSQQCLAPRLKPRALVKAAMRIGGIQAQVLSAAELALWARVEELAREDIQTALWQDRSLVKTWAMRGTLHLLAAEELPLYVAARALHDSRNWAGYFAYYGFTPAQHDALLSSVAHVLGDEPMTRQELAAAIGKHTGVVKLEQLILSSGWGSPLKPLAFRGDLCFGPSRGQNVTFVNPRAWIGKWQSIEPKAALQQIARLYLRTYGPATYTDFARWWWGGGGLVQAKQIFESLQEELEPVEVEGWRAFALRTTLEPMQNPAPLNAVHLLPLFDSYTFWLGRDFEPLLPKAFKSLVFRPQGWISAVVLVNGYVKGVWQYETRGLQTVVKVQMFNAPTASIRKGIQAQAERLGNFLNTKIVLEYK